MFFSFRNIKRVVFHTLDKFDGMDYQCLSPSQTRQIAGRAGRFGQDHTRGEVTTYVEYLLFYLD